MPSPRETQEALTQMRKLVGAQAFLSFTEGAKYFGGLQAPPKYVLAAAQKHLESTLTEFDARNAKWLGEAGEGEKGE